MRSRAVAAKVYVERMTVVDKDSMFRPKEPDTHYVRIVVLQPGSRCIVREYATHDRAQARQTYDMFRQSLGMT